MRAVDTNVLLRILVRDDERQVAIADAYIERGAWVSYIVLAEVLWVLTTNYRRGHAELAAAVEMLLDHNTLVIQDADAVRAALDQYRRNSSLGFADCLIVEVARKAGHLPVGTFDRKMTRLDGTEHL
jgi:predicted nucleic-acid-binding protein